MHYYINVLKKYAVISGRARRKEYWMFTLFNFIVSIAVGILDGMFGLRIGDSTAGVLQSLYGLAVFIPGFAVSVRRLHDTGRSGWWMLLLFIPIIGWIIYIVFLCQDSTPGENTYGSNPKGINEVSPKIV